MSFLSDLPEFDYSLALSSMVDTLVQQHWCVMPGFLSAVLCQQLYDELQLHEEQAHLRPARVGKDEQVVRRRDIRGDAILWLDGSTLAQAEFLSIMEALKTQINRELFMGLDELEAHFALYPPGTGYQKHLDSFQNDNLRRITIVAYLNPEWSEQDGGELLIYDGDEVIAAVSPKAGTLVCFVSEQMPHEVAITHQPRSSIAGWFRCRPDSIL